MQTINTSGITPEQLAVLDAYAQNAGAGLRDTLLSLAQCVRSGATLAVIDNAETMTPNEAATHLGMSRTHLYKLLDRGEIPFDQVGRDRRIRAHDLIDLEARRRRDRHELADRLAAQHATRAAAIDAVADLL